MAPERVELMAKCKTPGRRAAEAMDTVWATRSRGSSAWAMTGAADPSTDEREPLGA